MGILPKSVAALIPGDLRYPMKRFLQKSFYFGLAKVSGGRNNALLWSYGQFELSPSIILQGYMQGFFPLPNMKNNKIVDWYDPELRGVIPIHGFKAGNDFRRYLKKEKLKEADQQLEIKINTNFKETIIACAKPKGNKRTKTWLSPDYIRAALELHEMGMAHSVETYQNGVLVGGVIGFSINGYFTTLSQFHTVDNAGKVAFYNLLIKLKNDGFKLHLAGAADTWLSQYGMVTIEKDEFRADLLNALTSPVKFTPNLPELEF